MKQIVQTKSFKKDLKNYLHLDDKMAKLKVVLEYLRKGQKLPEQYQPHHLKGDQQHVLECHIEFDLLLIWIEPNKEIVKLLRFGTHAKLFDKKRR